MNVSSLGILLLCLCGSMSSRAPWYKFCWIDLCILDYVDPVCSWDPQHGSRIFATDCHRMRHNSCYNRNYGIINYALSSLGMVQLCSELGEMSYDEAVKVLVVKHNYIDVPGYNSITDDIRNKQHVISLSIP